MNKKVVAFCLTVAAAASTQLYGFRLISEVLKDPKIDTIFDAQKSNPTQRKFVEEYLLSLEKHYNTLNEKYGDETTRKYEKELDSLLKNFFLSVDDKDANDKAIEEIAKKVKEFADFIVKKEGAKTVELFQYIQIVFSNRLSVSSLECSFDHPEKNYDSPEAIQKHSIAGQRLGEKIVQKTLIEMFKEVLPAFITSPQQKK